jgi:hypothetical protein
MKIIKISMELGVEDTDIVMDDQNASLDNIAKYLNDKLYGDPEFFGDFAEENIYTICDEDGSLVYEKNRGWIR